MNEDFGWPPVSGPCPSREVFIQARFIRPIEDGYVPPRLVAFGPLSGRARLALDWRAEREAAREIVDYHRNGPVGR